MAGRKPTKAPQNRSLEEALRMRALGFRLVEEKEIVEEDDSGKRRVKTERTVKEIAPDLEALKLLTAMEERDGPGITIVSCVPRPERDAVETEVQA